MCDELLPPDIMHDILEGYLPYVCKQLLAKLRPYGITLQYVNTSIEAFDFAPYEKPSPVPESAIKSTDGTHFGQSGKKPIFL